MYNLTTIISLAKKKILSYFSKMLLVLKSTSYHESAFLSAHKTHNAMNWPRGAQTNNKEFLLSLLLWDDLPVIRIFSFSQNHSLKIIKVSGTCSLISIYVIQILWNRYWRYFLIILMRNTVSRKTSFCQSFGLFYNWTPVGEGGSLYHSLIEKHFVSV